MSGSLLKKSATSLQPSFSAHAAPIAKREKRKRLPPLSLRLSEGERAELKRLAGGKSLGGYIRERLFENSGSLRKPRTRKPPIHDHKMLARVLRALAQADTIKAIADLDGSCEDGLLMSEELEIEVRQACVNITAMRGNLMAALGLQSGAEP